MEVVQSMEAVQPVKPVEPAQAMQTTVKSSSKKPSKKPPGKKTAKKTATLQSPSILLRLILCIKLPGGVEEEGARKQGVPMNVDEDLEVSSIPAGLVMANF